MKVQLIVPPQALSPTAATALTPGAPIGAAYIAAALLQAGHQVSILDTIAAAPDQYTPQGRIIRLGLLNEQILDRIDPDATVLGISCLFSANWHLLCGIIKKIHERFPDKIIICGGEHFTALPEYSMERAPIDYVVMGEGEHTIVNLLDKIENHITFDPSTIAGICYRQDGKPLRSCAAPYIRNVDEIPLPAWDLVDLPVYDQYNMVGGISLGTRTVPMIATRGCPYECTYCAAPNMWGRRWYPRDPVKVVDELESYVKKYGTDHVPFQDLTMLMKRDWIVTFTGELIKRNINIKWQTLSGTRSEIINPEILQLIKQSGCDTLYYAPETGSDKVREGVHKYMNMDRLFQAITWTIEAGLNLGILLVVGFPHETEEDIKQTLKLARKLAQLGVIDVAVAFYTPLPGTAIFNELVAEGRLQLNDDTLSMPTFIQDKYLTEDRNMCRHMSAARLTYYKWLIVLNFFFLQWFYRPKRFLDLLLNILNDRDTDRMARFLNVSKRRFFIKMKKFFTSGAAGHTS